MYTVVIKAAVKPNRKSLQYNRAIQNHLLEPMCDGVGCQVEYLDNASLTGFVAEDVVQVRARLAHVTQPRDISARNPIPRGARRC